MGEDESRREVARSKVARIIEEYDLQDADQRLIDQWTAPEDQRTSLRGLADQFNREVLEATLSQAGIETVDGEVENTYRLLTSDDVSPGVRTEAQNRLRRDGINIDKLQNDFVSHQSIHTYLTKYRDIDYNRNTATPEERQENERETIQRLQSRTEAVTQNSIERLRASELLSVSSPDVFVDVRVYCEECGLDITADQLLQRGECDCPPSDGSSRTPAE